MKILLLLILFLHFSNSQNSEKKDIDSTSEEEFTLQELLYLTSYLYYRILPYENRNDTYEYAILCSFNLYNSEKTAIAILSSEIINYLRKIGSEKLEFFSLISKETNLIALIKLYNELFDLILPIWNEENEHTIDLPIMFGPLSCEDATNENITMQKNRFDHLVKLICNK